MPFKSRVFMKCSHSRLKQRHEVEAPLLSITMHEFRDTHKLSNSDMTKLAVYIVALSKSYGTYSYLFMSLFSILEQVYG